ncbi:MAG: GNAT family N-acetyltransferase [bacterium]|nr:GNAT family N-acetyltransferase [bacterium]
MISRGKPEELEAILELTRACGRHMRENGIDQWDENYPNLESLSRDIASETLFAYRENGEILGIIVLNETQDPEYAEVNWSTQESDRNIVVHRLAVSPQHQGKGIARKIMDFAEGWARENGFDAIRLDTYSQNPRNQRFYKKRGYTELGSVYLSYKKEHPYFCYELLLK